ncbi:MAG: glycosyltransferase family 4 protein [Gaiellaceae bacterium]
MTSPEAAAPLRVALVSFGFYEYVVKLATGLAQEASVSLFVPTRVPDELLETLDPSVEVVAFERPRLREPIRQMRMCRELVRQIEMHDPDVVHLQQGHVWFNLALRRLRRYPLVVTIHDHTQHPGDRNGRKSPQPIVNMGFREADSAIVHADVLRDQTLALGRVSEGVPVVTIPHPELVDVPAPLPAAEEPNLVLFFGRIWGYKGLEYLIRAEPLIAERVPGVRIAIAGEGEDLARYRRLMTDPERYEVHNHYVSATLRDKLFARASVVALPYIEASQSGVIPIAYAFSKPVVATRVGGLIEAVADGSTGVLVPTRDAAALASAIADLLLDSERRRNLGRAGRQKLATELSAEVVGAQTVAVYRDTLEGRPKAS